MARKKTGETCDRAGTYQFDGYVDGGTNPAPTANEREIPMKVESQFPPVRSSNKAAWWKWARS